MATALATETVQAAAERMTQQHVGALVVVEDSGQPVGILTDRDIVCRVLNERRDPGTTSIREVMSANPVVARDTERIDEVVFTTFANISAMMARAGTPRARACPCSR
ncbi:hypothetical protein DB31_8411 [Hyalangium minutum]|uniref:CBS domain-containing protein n=1 Tax=Hyalangium minutum TaxID=394096 RepID=A0A085WH95_9BACT|nr:hypothetical protein DB31_8411 [Hyalangium minutum]